MQATAQTAMPESALLGELSVLNSHAATVFLGQIVAVQRQGSVVTIRFRVEQAVRTTAATMGATFEMREWAGMWAPGTSRYLVGQRVLAFVHGNSTAGFSSPVHGAEGLVPVVVQGANAPRLLDVRRVAASVVRSLGTPLPTEANGAILLSDALQVLAAGADSAAHHGLLPVPTRGRRPVWRNGDGTPVISGSPAFGSSVAPLVPQQSAMRGSGSRTAMLYGSLGDARR